MLRQLLLTFALTITAVCLNAQDWVLQNPLENPSQLHDVYMDETGFGWTGGENSTLYYTTDFGQNWVDRSLPTSYGNIFYLDYVPETSGQHVVTAGTKIAYTTDAGQNWTEVITGINTGAFNGIQALADTAIYAIGNRGLLIKSQDGGANWTQVTLPMEIEWESMDFTDANTGWLGSRTGDIIHTTDGGQTWTVLHDSTFLGRVWLRFLNEDFGYMAEGRNFLQTTDGGLTWDTLAQNVFPSTINDIEVIDSLNILVSQNTRIAWTHDGGMTWSSANNHPYISTTNGGIHGHPDGKVWVANKWRSVLYSDDFGDSWVDQFPAFKGYLGYIDAFDEKNVVAVGSSGLGIHTQNSGLDWEEFSSVDLNYTSFSGLATLSEKVFVLSGGQEIMSTRDGGTTWQTDTTFDSGFIRSMSQDPDGNLYALHNLEGIFTSTDSGLTWQSVPTPPGAAYTWRGNTWYNDSLGILLGSQGRIFRTEDGGQNWDSIPSGNTRTLTDVFWSGAHDAWVLASASLDSIMHSSNAGISWEMIALPRKTTWRDIEFADSLRGWLVGGSSTDGYILETTDGGQTWTEVHTQVAPYHAITIPKVADTLMVWASGLGGVVDFLGIIDTTTADTSGGDTSTTAFWNQAAADFKVYPNPSEGFISLKTPFSSSQPLSLQVFDVSGRQVADYRWAQVPTRVDLTELPDGLYLIRMHQGNRIAVRRWKKE